MNDPKPTWAACGAVKLVIFDAADAAVCFALLLGNYMAASFVTASDVTTEAPEITLAVQQRIRRDRGGRKKCTSIERP